MKYRSKIQKSIVLIILSMLLFSCYSSQTLDSPTTNYSQQSVAKTVEEPAVLSLCSLMDNPYPYHQKVIIVKTTLYRIGSLISFEDEKCVTRHTLVDVEFAPEFKSSACDSKDEIENKLCLITRRDDENKGISNLSVTGNLVVYFEYYYSDEGFTSNGLRFRFVVHEIKNIEKITPITSVNLN
jgi:hypothetical protein